MSFDVATFGDLGAGKQPVKKAAPKIAPLKLDGKGNFVFDAGGTRAAAPRIQNPIVALANQYQQSRNKPLYTMPKSIKPSAKAQRIVSLKGTVVKIDALNIASDGAISQFIKGKLDKSGISVVRCNITAAGYATWVYNVDILVKANPEHSNEQIQQWVENQMTSDFQTFQLNVETVGNGNVAPSQVVSDNAADNVRAKGNRSNNSSGGSDFNWSDPLGFGNLGKGLANSNLGTALGVSTPVAIVGGIIVVLLLVKFVK